MYRVYTPQKKTKHKKRTWPLYLLLVVIVGVGAWLWWPSTPDKGTDKRAPEQSNQKSEESKKPVRVNLQPVIDQWVAGQGGDYSIVVYDPDNKATIATHQADTQYFTASIYKLYVAYLALMDIEDGVQDPDEVYRGDWTRQKCIEEMIRSSNSPCAEAMLAEMGHATVNQRLKDFGLTGTSFPAFMTTAGDSMAILKRLHEHRELNDSSTNLLLNAMKNQIYREGFPKGMPEATVADKVGFYETGYHDVAIVTLPNKREYLVAVLSEDARAADIASLGSIIYAKLTEN